jgi:hypothetical protein
MPSTRGIIAVDAQRYGGFGRRTRSATRRKATMFLPFDPQMLTVIALMAAADPVPAFNVEPHCRAVAAKAVPVGDPAACMKLEQEARVQLVNQWDQFTAADKDHCLPLSTMAGEPTYSELLTCLEVERDARLLREKKRPGTTGAAERYSNFVEVRGGENEAQRRVR